jgi:hypothetical protein
MIFNQAAAPSRPVDREAAGYFQIIKWKNDEANNRYCGLHKFNSSVPIKARKVAAFRR